MKLTINELKEWVTPLIDAGYLYWEEDEEGPVNELIDAFGYELAEIEPPHPIRDTTDTENLLPGSKAAIQQEISNEITAMSLETPYANAVHQALINKDKSALNKAMDAYMKHVPKP